MTGSVGSSSLSMHDYWNRPEPWEQLRNTPGNPGNKVKTPVSGQSSLDSQNVKNISNEQLQSIKKKIDESLMRMKSIQEYENNLLIYNEKLGKLLADNISNPEGMTLTFRGSSMQIAQNIGKSFGLEPPILPNALKGNMLFDLEAKSQAGFAGITLEFTSYGGQSGSIHMFVDPVTLQPLDRNRSNRGSGTGDPDGAGGDGVVGGPAPEPWPSTNASGKPLGDPGFIHGSGIFENREDIGLEILRRLSQLMPSAEAATG